MKIIKQLKIGSILIISFLMIACGGDAENNAQTNMQEAFLPVEKAFVLTVTSVDDKTINAHWEIADDYLLYKDKFEFSLVGENYQISALDMPKGVMIEDKVFGNKESYQKSVDINITLKAIKAAGSVNMNISYQGCSVKGLCYPPQHVERTVTFN